MEVTTKDGQRDCRGRTRIVEIMADAMRFGMTLAELIAGVVPK